MSAAPQISDGSRPDLEDIYRDHLQFAWRTVRYLGVPAADAEDVVHEVFIIVQRRLTDYDPRYSVRSWIAGITRRVVLHYRRKTSRTKSKIAKITAPTDGTPAPDEQVSRQEAAALLTSFLDGLPQPKREAFVLGQIEGLSAVEVGRIVGQNANTVASRLRSARQAFQARVDTLQTIGRREGG